MLSFEFLKNQSISKSHVHPILTEPPRLRRYKFCSNLYIHSKEENYNNQTPTIIHVRMVIATDDSLGVASMVR